MSHDRGCSCGNERYEYDACYARIGEGCTKSDIVRRWQQEERAKMSKIDEPGPTTTTFMGKTAEELAEIIRKQEELRPRPHVLLKMAQEITDLRARCRAAGLLQTAARLQTAEMTVAEELGEMMK